MFLREETLNWPFPAGSFTGHAQAEIGRDVWPVNSSISGFFGTPRLS